MTKRKINIGYLYGDLMNIYGDAGNIIVLKKRLEWRGIEVEVKNFSVGERMQNNEIDLVFFGGGQDEAQGVVADDLVKTGKGEIVKQNIEEGMPTLAICGGYQLLGDYYQADNGEKLIGVGALPVYTKAGHRRMIGNMVIETESLGKVVGFENHWGKTYLKDGAQAFGEIVVGGGNNGEDGLEGCMYKHAVGCYMHGSLLPKNPKVADQLLAWAWKRKFGEAMPQVVLEEVWEERAREVVLHLK
jgi:lipid II isoglutaminyl synthase (glutamine-hydrolysing)